MFHHDQNYRNLERLAQRTRDSSAPSDWSGLSNESVCVNLAAESLTNREGKAPRLSPTLTSPLELPSDVLRGIQKLISPAGHRPEGISVFPTSRPLSSAEFADLKDYTHLSYEHDGIVDLARVEKIFPNQKLYHATNGLSYALNRQLGWLAPDDVAFVAQEICGIKDYLEIDPGFFMGTDPRWVAGYAIPWPLGRPNDILNVLRIPTDNPAIQRLSNIGLLREIDPTAYRQQLPSTDCFVIRQTDINRRDPVFELIAPIAPTESRIRAVLDWNSAP